MILGGKSWRTSSFILLRRKGRTCRWRDSIASAPEGVWFHTDEDGWSFIRNNEMGGVSYIMYIGWVEFHNILWVGVVFTHNFCVAPPRNIKLGKCFVQYTSLGTHSVFQDWRSHTSKNLFVHYWKDSYLSSIPSYSLLDMTVLITQPHNKHTYF